MIKHCPTCDRTSDEFKFVGEFCEVCVTRKISDDMPGSIAIDRCKSCERVRTPTGYAAPDRISIKEAMQQVLGKRCSISVESHDWKHAVVRFTCNIDGNEASFEKKIAMHVKKTMCMDCYRKTSGYYEAIFQLRGPRDPVDKMMKRFVNYIEKHGAFVSRVDELNNGYDIYMSDKRIASDFFGYYELKPKRSYTLYGLRRGKKIYRNTYMLRLS